jgi:hypothetical protein
MSGLDYRRNLDYQRTVVGYHGCDQEILESVLLGRGKLEASRNNYDWLGSGIYFWEYGVERALQWAVEISRRGAGRIRNPAVLGGLIHLGFCFDLLDVRFTEWLREMFPLFTKTITEHGGVLPRNEGLPGNPEELALRKLDCAFLNWAVPFLEAQTGQTFHTVRGVFQEGEPAYEGSSIMRKSHIQIAVRDRNALLGYFGPEILTDEQ